MGSILSPHLTRSITRFFVVYPISETHSANLQGIISACDKPAQRQGQGTPETESEPLDKLHPLHTSTKRDLLWVPGDSPVFRARQPAEGGDPSAGKEVPGASEALAASEKAEIPQSNPTGKLHLLD